MLAVKFRGQEGIYNMNTYIIWKSNKNKKLVKMQNNDNNKVIIICKSWVMVRNVLTLETRHNVLQKNPRKKLIRFVLDEACGMLVMKFKNIKILTK
jgi:hypothetical protein